MKTIIAVDPGASGGISVMIPGLPAKAFAMPQTNGDILEILRCNIVPDDCVVFIEQLVKHMGAGIPASTMAVYACNWGVVTGMAMALGARLEIIRPEVWQKGLSLGITGRQKAEKGASNEEKKAVQLANQRLKKQWKDHLKGRAQELYPHIKVTLKNADSLLILEYARRAILE